ncbi:hypothetical protein JCM16303_001056 [Sporobolomyces ruberrimus]
MASDDPAISLPRRGEQGDESIEQEISSHLTSIRNARHFRNPKQNDIYNERIRAEHDTVTQEWFDDQSTRGGVYSTIRGERANASSSRFASKDKLKNAEGHVKLNVRRAGSKATDTFRRIRNKSIFSTGPRITVEPHPDRDDNPDNPNDIPLRGAPIRPERTNSSFNTITLPAFDLARYRSTTSSQSVSTLSTVEFIPQSYSPRSNTPLHSPWSPHDIEPPARVPTPPPFPSSPQPPYQHRPTSPQGTPATSPSTTFSPTSPFLNLTSLPPLSEESTSRTLSSSPTSSLRNFPSTTTTSSSSPPASASASEQLQQVMNQSNSRRTLTIDDYHSPSAPASSSSQYPNRRDTFSSLNPLSRTSTTITPSNNIGRKNSLLVHLKNSLHLSPSPVLQQSSSFTSPTQSRPTTPPPLGGGVTRPGLSRSPTSTLSISERAKGSNKKRAKEELQRLLVRRRRKQLSRKYRNSGRSRGPRVPGQEDEEEEDDEGEEEEETQGIDREIVERLKVLGALVEEEERVESDILWEHQRGLLVFGLPKFSSAALFQFDPSVWTDEKFKTSPYTPRDFPCRPYWRWRDSEFMVDMGGDRDEEGWSYASFFHSKHWRGEPSLLRSFVRRRKWIRTRIYIPLPTSNSISSKHHHQFKPSCPTTTTVAKNEEEGATKGYHGTNGLDIEEEEAQAEIELDEAPGNGEILDLKSACDCLPLTLEEKQVLYHSLSTNTTCTRSRGGGSRGRRGRKGGGEEGVCYIPPKNPFIPFRIILEYAKHQREQQGGGGGGNGKEGQGQGAGKEGRELVWRQGIREINERRVKEVLKKVARIDRERLKLWKIWLRVETCQEEEEVDEERGRERGRGEEEEFECSEWSEWRSGEKEGSWTEWFEDYRGSDEDQEDGGDDGGDGKKKTKKKDWEIKEEDGGDRVGEEDFVNDKRKSAGSRQSARRKAGGEDQGVGLPDLEDVWDLIESRLDNILALFDYHLTRLSFLRLLIQCHPLASTPFPSSPTSNGTKPRVPRSNKFVHKHEGWDLPFEERRRKQEVEWEKRLKWVLGVKEEVSRMEGGRGPPAPEKGRERETKEQKERELLERTRSERRARKGKQRAINLD